LNPVSLLAQSGEGLTHRWCDEVWLVIAEDEEYVRTDGPDPWDELGRLAGAPERLRWAEELTR